MQSGKAPRAHIKERSRQGKGPIVAEASSSRSRTGGSAGKKQKRVPFNGRCLTCRVTGWDDSTLSNPAQANHNFYCQECISKRIEDHFADCVRIGNSKDQIREKVSKHLGPHAEKEQLLEAAYSSGSARGAALLDPFSGGVASPGKEGHSEAEAPLHPIGHTFRAARAWRAELRKQAEWMKMEGQRSREEVKELRGTVASRKERLTQRRRNLKLARSIELSDPFAEQQAGFSGPGAWPSIPALPPTQAKSGIAATLRRVKLELDDLKKGDHRTAMKLSSTRAILVKEALRLFNIQPPAGSMARDGKILNLIQQRGQSAFSASPSAAARALRKAIGSPGASPMSNDWTILGLVLPQPTTLGRFSCEDINGAVSHTVMLLQMLSSYLGVMLPFSIGSQGGRSVIRPNKYWHGSGIDAGKHVLELSSAAHGSITSRNENRGTSFSQGASHMAASAISSMGSFVNLGSIHISNAPHAQETDEEKDAERDSATARSLKSFRTALIMLAFDAVYLAETQGSLKDSLRPTDPILPAIAVVPLRLLHHLRDSTDLGRQSHEANSALSSLQTFALQSLDFKTLWLSYEPASKADKKDDIIMEGSYVDAKADATSMLLREKVKPSKGRAPTPSTLSAIEPSTAQSSKPGVPGRQQRKDAAAAPSDLEFLRQKGRQVGAKASKTTSITIDVDGAKLLREVEGKTSRLPEKVEGRGQPSDSNTSARKSNGEKPRGTVMFNGKPVQHL